MPRSVSQIQSEYYMKSYKNGIMPTTVNDLVKELIDIYEKTYDYMEKFEAKSLLGTIYWSQSLNIGNTEKILKIIRS